MYKNEEENHSLIDVKVEAENGFERNMDVYHVPEFIIEQKTICEKSRCVRIMFCCCCCRKYRHNSKYFIFNISNDHLSIYHRLKQHATQNYDENNSLHEESLNNLLSLCFESTSSSDLNTSDWKKIGFQSNNPRTDFRGGGYISLLFIIHFVKYYREDYEETINFEYFLFALVAIKLMFYFKIIFNFIDEDDESSIPHSNHNYLMKIHKLKYPSIPQFKNFTTYLLTNQNFHFELLSKCLNQIKEEYKKQYNPVIKEMNFLIIEPIIYKSFMETIYRGLD